MISRVNGFSGVNQMAKADVSADQIKKRLVQVYKYLASALVSYGKDVLDNLKHAPEKIKEDAKNFAKEYEAAPAWAKALFKQYLQSQGIDADKVIKIMIEISNSIK